MVEELYPGPNHLKFYLPVPIIAASTIYLDILSEGYTNPIIFFIATVIVPVMFAAIASGVTGKRFLSFFGIRGTTLTNLGLFLITSGLTMLVFFLFITPLSLIYRGTWMYSALRVFYFPLSEMSLRTLTTIPLTFIIIYYFTIAVGEEIIKFYGQQVIADWLYVHFNYPKVIAIVLGILISWIGWIIIHLPGNPAIVTPFGLALGLGLSAIWFLPFYLFAESLFDPSPGINLTIYSLAGTIGGHFTYDFLVEASSFGYITLENTLFYTMLGIGIIVAGILLIAYEYKRRGLPIFGIIKI